MSVAFNNSAGFDTAVAWINNQDSEVRNWDPVNDLFIHDYIDMNGDGLPDDVYKPYQGNWSVRLNRGWISGVGYSFEPGSRDWGAGWTVNVGIRCSGDDCPNDLIDIWQESGSTKSPPSTIQIPGPR